MGSVPVAERRVPEGGSGPSKIYGTCATLEEAGFDEEKIVSILQAALVQYLRRAFTPEEIVHWYKTQAWHETTRNEALN